MTPLEKRAAYTLASIFSLRMLGLFLILPVFALYAEELSGTTPALIGLAIGIYGLSQAVFQIPFGVFSDRWGRKPIIVGGLLIFAAGSVVAALADSIWGVIFGRALQGAGAISAAVMALAADLTREDHRLKVMAVIGTSIGLSFTASLIAGPILSHWIGVQGIFWLTAVLALAGIAVIKLLVPDPVVSRHHHDTEPDPHEMSAMLKDTQLLRLDYGIFTLHALLTASFIVVPFALRDGGIDSHDQSYLYLAVMLLAILVMVPLIIVAEKRRRMKQVFVGAVALLLLSEVTWIFGFNSLVGVVAGLSLFFIAFNLLEATLPSLIAKTAPAGKKGTAMGLYSSSQFLGAFFGGAVGGWLYGDHGASAVFIFCLLLTTLWLGLAATMRPPRHLSSKILAIGQIDMEAARQLAQRLRQVRGVEDATVIPDEGVAYLKVDNQVLDQDALREFSVAAT